MTPYNQLQNLERAGLGKRQFIADPGSGGTVKIFPTDRGVLQIDTAGARTLQAASQLAAGTEILCCSTVAGVTVNGFAIGAGQYSLFRITLDSSGANQWSVVSDSDTATASRGVETVTKSSLTDSATVTAAQVLTKWIEGTPTANADYTLPTAALLAAAIPGIAAGDSFILTVNNVAANAANGKFDIRLIAGSGGTLAGNMTVSPGASNAFRITFTSTSAYTVTSVSNGSMWFGNAGTQAAGNATLTVAQITSGLFTLTGSGASTLTLPTAAAVIAAFGNPAVGFTWWLTINNNSDNTITLSAGGATLEGSAATIATTAARMVCFQISNVGTAAYTACLVI